MSTDQPAPATTAAVDTVVAALPAILAFGGAPELLELRRRYVLLLSDGLGTHLGRLHQVDPVAGQALARRLDSLPTASFVRVLIAPETAHRLLWPELHEEAEVTHFLRRAVEAERARLGAAAELDGPTWTALGDQLVGGADDTGPGLDDFPPLVVGDPATRHPTADGSGAAGEAELAAPEGDFAPDDLAVVLTRLADARLRLCETGAEVWQFVRELNTTLVVMTGSGTRAGFCSSSPERYVGRSILWNPHLPDVQTADLAEALVHEAIHTVLDSADALLSRATPRSPRWVTDPALYDGVSRTVSPWTGRELDVPTYVHAYLVWYALLGFWTRALVQRAFDGTTARQRIIKAGAPFMSRTARAPLQPFASAIRPDVADLLEGIEATVAAEFAELTGQRAD